ncbi:MAG: hypothetical protein ACC645_02935 [Pirellulales bacterium]
MKWIDTHHVVGLFASVLSAALLTAPSPVCGEEVAAEPSWEIVPETDLRQQVIAWLDGRETDPEAVGKARALWPEGGESADRVDRLASTLALVLPGARTLVQQCDPFSGPLPQQAALWLDDAALSGFVRNNMRLYYGRWLARREYYDESLAQLEDLQPDQVADPVTLLFYRAVDLYRLVTPEPCREDLRCLLQREADLPQRYRHLAHLLLDDLDGLKTDSLDEIARRMDDVRRRLDLGRANRKVREVEDGIIASLDKLIKELEDKQQEQQGGGSNGQSGGQQPAEKSQIMSGRGPGKVHKKNIGHKTEWGNLPPKQREEALQQIGRQFPSHYRDVIEQYFKKLASEDGRKKDE